MSHPWPMGPGRLESASESDPASLSPRTALLSPPFDDDVGLSDLPHRIPRGPGIKFRHERERAHSTAAPRDLLQMLVTEEYESKQMRKLLYTAFDRLERETKRAEAAEASRDETLQRARAINEARAAVQQQAARAQEELKLYKLQLDNAQKEILRAQDVLKAIEAQRDEAEAAAVSARSRARRLNEERLIELAREEGRRLGFEEGVRRGRKIGYREAYVAGEDDRREELQDVAAAVVDRLLEDREEPEQIEVLQEPTPIPPPSSSRSAPEVYRVGTPVNSSLEQIQSSRGRHDSSESDNRSARRAHQPEPPAAQEPRIIPASATPIPIVTSQPSRPASQPWSRPPTDPAFSRPPSVQNSPRSMRQSDILPDGYIPTADSNHNFTLPPPHGLQRSVPSPTPSQRTLGQPSESRRSRDYMYDSYVPPRRGSDDDSLASGKQSAASTISQLDIVGLPSSGRHRDRSQGLSVIHEDASMRSERMTDYSQTIASASQTGRSSFREMRSSDTLRQDREAKQHLADELRYSDPSEAEQWRRQVESSRSQPPRDGPPRQRPAHITVPTPLSPPRVLQHQDSRQRRMSERQGRSETRDYRDHLSPDSSVPEINVEPPSGPPSDAPSRGRGPGPINGLLSPDHANHPLPPPVAPPSGGRHSPVIPTGQFSSSPSSSSVPLAGQFYAVQSDRQQPPSFLPSPWDGDGGSQGVAFPKQTSGGGAPQPQRYAVPGTTSSEREREREREGGRSRSPISFYTSSPVPTGVTYPAPPISRSATYSAGGQSYVPSAGSNASGTSEGGRRRRDSLSAGAGMTSGSRARPVASTGSTTDSVGGGGGGGGSRHSRVGKRQSSASLASQQSQPHGGYPRYDSAYLASNDSLRDSGTEPVIPVRVREHGHPSPAYMYAGLPRSNE